MLSSRMVLAVILRRLLHLPGSGQCGAAVCEEADEGRVDAHHRSMERDAHSSAYSQLHGTRTGRMDTGHSGSTTLTDGHYANTNMVSENWILEAYSTLMLAWVMYQLVKNPCIIHFCLIIIQSMTAAEAKCWQAFTEYSQLKTHAHTAFISSLIVVNVMWVVYGLYKRFKPQKKDNLVADVDARAVGGRDSQDDDPVIVKTPRNRSFAIGIVVVVTLLCTIANLVSLTTCTSSSIFVVVCVSGVLLSASGVVILMYNKRTWETNPESMRRVSTISGSILFLISTVLGVMTMEVNLMESPASEIFFVWSNLTSSVCMYIGSEGLSWSEHVELRDTMVIDQCCDENSEEHWNVEGGSATVGEGADIKLKFPTTYQYETRVRSVICKANERIVNVIENYLYEKCTFIPTSTVYVRATVVNSLWRRDLDEKDMQSPVSTLLEGAAIKINLQIRHVKEGHQYVRMIVMDPLFRSTKKEQLKEASKKNRRVKREAARQKKASGAAETKPEHAQTTNVDVPRVKPKECARLADRQKGDKREQGHEEG